MVWLGLLLWGCSDADPEPQVCDTEKYICDTAAWWLRQRADDGTVDPSTGTWLDGIFLPGCLDGTWTYEATARGPTNGSALVNAWIAPQAGGYNEEQPLDSVGDLPEGEGERFRTELVPGVDAADVVYGERTALACGTHDVNPIMTYTVRLYDADGNLADCGAFTTRLSLQIALEELFDTPTDMNPVTAREEITRDNCAVWSLPPEL